METKPTPTKRKRKLVVRKKPKPTPKPKLEDAYLEQLSDTEKIALKIAHHQLESSFCLEKSIGFLQFKEKSSTE
tara:strand:- start:471 stop:692 length:222 start_codon:yes stop_codon:yes gene_type:complete